MVISIVLVALGIPLWLVLGALGVGLKSRRAFRQEPGVFEVKTRDLDRAAPASKWPRRTVYARWVHDVLIVHKGIALVRNRALPVASVSPAPIVSGELSGLGDDPVGVRLHLDGGEVVDVAAASADREALRGPFSDRLSAPST